MQTNLWSTVVGSVVVRLRLSFVVVLGTNFDATPINVSACSRLPDFEGPPKRNLEETLKIAVEEARECRGELRLVAPCSGDFERHAATFGHAFQDDRRSAPGWPQFRRDRAKFGGFRGKFGRASSCSQIWTELGRSGRFWPGPEIARDQSGSAGSGLALAGICPRSAENDNVLNKCPARVVEPASAETAKILANFGRHRAEFGRRRPNLAAR